MKLFGKGANPAAETAGVTEEAVLNALRQVIDPDLHRDVVDLGFIKDVKICEGLVGLTMELTTPACPVKDQMKKAAEQAVLAVPGVTRAEVHMTAQVRQSHDPWSERAPVPGVRNIVAVASGKGGVGKSTVAVNLAVSLARQGARVGLMDADIYGPSIPLMMGAQDARMMGNEAGRLLPLEAHGVKIVSIGFLLGKDAPVVWRGPMVGRAVQQLVRDCEWGELDYLIIDLPPGTGDAQLSLAQSVPLAGGVIVTTPQDIALLDATRGLSMFREVKVPVLGIVENMSYFACPHCGERTNIFSHGGGETTAARLKVPFLGAIPLDIDVRIGGDTGMPISAAKPDSPQSLAFMELASRVAAAASVAAMDMQAQSEGFVPLNTLASRK
ncbi:MAG TPA: iron-sulfur cluster carrier protein ApbC [Armatimonadota bacterium]|jgi:ATP-binding protein involved in chromosome partitioning